MPPFRTSESIGDFVTAKRGATSYEEVRRMYEEYMHVTFHELGLASRSQTQELKQWIESLDPGDDVAIAEAYKWYQSDYSKRLGSALQLHSEFLQPLHSAWKEGAISEQSYNDWVRWIRSEDRPYKEKETAIRSDLQSYLKDRFELHAARVAVLKDKNLEQVTESQLRKQIDDLRDNKIYFTKFSFSERKNLVGLVSAQLKVTEGGGEYKKLFDETKKILEGATKPPAPALHRDKVGTWLDRIFKSGASTEQIKDFLDRSKGNSLHNLIDTWRQKFIEYYSIREHEAFRGVKTGFVNTKGFLWMNYKDRVKYVEEMRRKQQVALELRTLARSRIHGASTILSAGAADRWLHQYVFNGNHSLEELSSIINGNLHQRLDAKMRVVNRFEVVSRRARRYQGIRGMPLPEKSSFLQLHYDKQLSQVQEMEKRLLHLEHNRPDFLHIRHFMDRDDFDEALVLIEEARKKDALTFEEDGQLNSMEQYIRYHRKVSVEKQEGEETVLSEAKQIDALIRSGLPELQDLYISLCERGSAAIGALGWTEYNRKWCNVHGYLNPEREHNAITRGKSEARERVRRKKRGVVSETVSGTTREKEYIELSRTSPTNICLDISDGGAKSSFAETLYQKRNDHRALYWTNCILHHGGSLMPLEQQNEECLKVYKMRNLLRRLEAKNQRYAFQRSVVSMEARKKSSSGK